MEILGEKQQEAINKIIWDHHLDVKPNNLYMSDPCLLEETEGCSCCSTTNPVNMDDLHLSLEEARKRVEGLEKLIKYLEGITE